MERRKLLLIVISAVSGLIVVLAIVGIVLFVHQTSATAANTPTPTVTSTTTTATGRACALGTIQSIGSQSFVVAENRGKKIVTVVVDSVTTIHMRGKIVQFTDLTVGERVRVTSQGTCDRLAASFNAQNIVIVVTAGTPTPTPAVSSPTPSAG